ncbi:MAG TPA: ADOP family duplicated permease [Lacunisphaera sp.]|nr:ADOP family duplicated permease [Lacunisphaera sp.]
MKILRQFLNLFRRRRIEADMAEEMRAHLELQAARNRAAGMDAAEADQAAQREFGNVASLQEQAREARGWTWIEELGQDLRYAWRTLLKSPGFTTVVVLTLALGVGLNTVVFSFYHLLTGKPLSVRAPEQILRVSADDRRFQSPFTLEEVENLQAGLHSTSAVIASSPQQVLLLGVAGGDHQLPTAVQFVSDNYFAALGVPARQGRIFGRGEESVAVISHEAWQRRFQDAADIVGQTVTLRGAPVTIIGVAPESFGGTTPPSSPDFWLPLAAQPAILPSVNWVRDRSARIWQVQVRREDGFTPGQVGAEVAAMAGGWPQPDGKPLRTKTEVATFFQLGGAQVHAVCIALLLAVGLILLVGCINIVNLIHARNAWRSHELAIRLALGASRWRLLRQLAAESLLLGLAGGGVGFLVAFWACEGIRAWATTLIRKITMGTWSPFLEFSPDCTVFAYSLGLAVAASLITGMRPAWLGAGINVNAALKNRPGAPGTLGARAGRNRLLALQVATSLVLLAGTGLLLSAARRALTTEPGFDARHVISVVAWSNLDTAATGAEQARRAREIEEHLRGVPGVIAVAGAERAPFTGHSITAYVTDDGRWMNGCVGQNVAPEYFAALGLDLVAGRHFTDEEALAGAKVVIISESAARHLWPGKNPLGRQLESPQKGRTGPAPGVRFTVVGVVRDARLTNLSEVDDIDLFFPLAGSAHWLVRTQGDPAALIQPIYAELGKLDAKLPAQMAVWTLEEGSMRIQRLFARVPADCAMLLGGIALALAAVGIYGVVAFLVARRTHEIGVRLALGARPGDVVSLVLRQNLSAVAWGAGCGLAGAFGLSILLDRLVLRAVMPDITYGAGMFPVVPYAAALLVLLVVLTVAAWLPARRAARVDPMVALRAE